MILNLFNSIAIKIRVRDYQVAILLALVAFTATQMYIHHSFKVDLSQVNAHHGAHVATQWDSIPDFCENPTKTTVASGNWSNPSVWSGGNLPSSSDKVLISSGHSVAYDSTSGVADCLGIKGTLNFRTDMNTVLRVGNILVYDVGHLIVGTTSNPVSPNNTADIIIANKALDANMDPNQYGTGLLAWGEVKMHGAVKDPTFIRLATEPLAGQNSIQLSQTPVGWKVGDRIIIPDTRVGKSTEINWENWQFLQPQWEELTIQNISGSMVTLSQPLAYDHKGARDGNGVLDFLPHVGNFSRNVKIRSELPMGSGTQGHVLFTHRADIDVRYVWFKDLGRTLAAATGPGNQIGRYALHMHHVSGPTATPANGYQYTLIGNSIDGGPTNHNVRWALAVHDSHYGLIKDNVAYNYNGWIIGTEDGSESYNVFDHNFALRSAGRGGRNGGAQEANEGGGFTFRGPNNFVRNNVTANIHSNGPDAAYGYKHAFEYLGNIKVPNFKGADTSTAGQFTVKDGYSMALLEFNNNEVYGSQSGYSNWWVGTFSTEPRTADINLIKDFKVWNVFNKAIFNYPSGHYIYDGLITRGDPNHDLCCSTAFEGGDYHLESLVIKNSDIQGYRSGIRPSLDQGQGIQTIENTKLRNYVNIPMDTLVTSSYTSDNIPRRSVEVRNVKFEAWPGQPLRPISMNYNGLNGTRNHIQKDEIKVYDYNQQAGVNFQVYYDEQVPGFLVPQTIFAADGKSSVKGSPESGLTNLQNWNKYGIAIARGVAPCNDAVSRPEINGVVCSSGPLPPPANPLPTISFHLSSIYGAIDPGESTQLNWTVLNANNVSIDQGIGTVAASGSRPVTPSASTIYRLTASNSSGTIVRDLALTVNGTQPPPPPPPAPNPVPPPVSPPPSLVGDLNGDCLVNSLDFSILNGRWGTNDATADLNRDGLVNSIDFSLMNANWFETC
jgi:hypothetical protein